MNKKLYLWQTKSGAIRIGSGGSKSVLLEENQVSGLGITLYELDDFDIDDYKKFYNKQATQLTLVVADSANAPRLHRSEVTEISECPTCGSILTPNS